jgi:hypothetical protein
VLISSNHYRRKVSSCSIWALAIFTQYKCCQLTWHENLQLIRGYQSWNFIMFQLFKAKFSSRSMFLKPIFGARMCLRSCQSCSISTISQHSMETFGSLRQAKDQSLVSYPEQEQSTPNQQVLLFLRLLLPICLFPSGFPFDNLYTIISPKLILHVLSIPFPKAGPFWREWIMTQVMKLLIMQYSPASCNLNFPSSNILLSTMFVMLIP